VRRPQRPRGPQWVSHASVRRAAGGGTLDTCIQPLITDPWTVGGTSGCEVATGCEQLVETIFRQVFCLTFGGSGRYQSNAKHALRPDYKPKTIAHRVLGLRTDANRFPSSP